MTTPERVGPDISWLAPVALLVVAPLLYVAGASAWLGIGVILAAAWYQHSKGWL